MDYNDKKYRRFPERTHTFEEIVTAICYSRNRKRILNNYQIIEIHQMLNGHSVLNEKIWIKLDLIFKLIEEEKWEKPELLYETRSRKLIIKRK